VCWQCFRAPAQRSGNRTSPRSQSRASKFGGWSGAETVYAQALLICMPGWWHRRYARMERGCVWWGLQYCRSTLDAQFLVCCAGDCALADHSLSFLLMTMVGACKPCRAEMHIACDERALPSGHQLLPTGTQRPGAHCRAPAGMVSLCPDLCMLSFFHAISIPSDATGRLLCNVFANQRTHVCQCWG
jgi:hypothetical protein